MILHLQDIVTVENEGEPKVTEVTSLSESVLPGTASHGKEIIHRETESLRQDWEQFTDNLQQVWWCSGGSLGLLCRFLVVCIVVVWDPYVDF